MEEWGSVGSGVGVSSVWVVWAVCSWYSTVSPCCYDYCGCLVIPAEQVCVVAV